MNNPRITTINSKKLLGKKISMSFANNKTGELWKDFAPKIKNIKHKINEDLYSVEIYNDVNFFNSFNPHQDFEKWAAVEVENFENIPENMEELIIPKGDYAVFHYIGKPSEARETFLYIYGEWLPNSNYKLDDRPYFALMGENYRGEDPNSEEEFWIPIKLK